MIRQGRPEEAIQAMKGRHVAQGLWLVATLLVAMLSVLRAQEPPETNYDESKVAAYTLPLTLPTGISVVQRRNRASNNSTLN